MIFLCVFITLSLFYPLKSMSENQIKIEFKELKFMGMKELAAKWGVHRQTLSRYIHKMSDQIPMYQKHQKVFAPIQYKKLAELLGFEI